MPIAELADIVARLDGTSGDHGELRAIALPPLFGDDLAEYLDSDLIRFSLSTTEQELIRQRDLDYVTRLREQRRAHARLLKTARDEGSLAEAPGVKPSAARRTFRDLRRLRNASGEERAGKEQKFRHELRAQFGEDPDAGLFTFLGSTVESFIWRPGMHRTSVWLAEDGARAEVEELIGARLSTADDTFVEVAHFRGILYHVFPRDSHPIPRIIYTDHEVAWKAGHIHDGGALDEFLSQFLTVDEVVGVAADAMR